MKLVCLTRTVPDGACPGSHQESPVPVRDTPIARIAPQDAPAIGLALEMKKRAPETNVEVVILAEHPSSTIGEDLARVGADMVTVIHDALFQGSDSLSQARIMNRYLSTIPYDCVLTGNGSAEEGDAGLPATLAELQATNYLSCVHRIDETNFTADGVVVEVEDPAFVTTYHTPLPAVFALSQRSGYRLPYPRLKDRQRDVSDRIVEIGNRELRLAPSEIVSRKTPGQGARSGTRERPDRQRRVVAADPDGVETVITALKAIGILGKAPTIAGSTRAPVVQCRSGEIRQLRREKKTERDIRDSDVLVSGGAGIAESFETLKPLAVALGGQVCASRSLVNRGLAPRSLQVGQSGRRVAPRLYLAMGIHGAMQHVTAIEGADFIISVNTNANAPICSLSDVVVVGDAAAFAKELLRRIAEEQKNGTH